MFTNIRAIANAPGGPSVSVGTSRSRLHGYPVNIDNLFDFESIFEDS
jgi:hypothetical protein